MKISRKWTLIHTTNDNEVMDEVVLKAGNKMTARVLTKVNNLQAKALGNSEFKVVYTEES